MKVSIICLLFAATFLAQETEAAPFWGAGIGFRRFGLFGGPFGFGRFGFGGFGGFGGFPIPVPVPVPAIAPIGLGFGKRDVQEHNIWDDEKFNANETLLCRIIVSANDSDLTCKGLDVEFNTTLIDNIDHIIFPEVILSDLFIEPVNGTESGKIWRIVKQVEGDEFTFKQQHDEKKEVLLSIYFDEEIKDLGFRVKDSEDWEKFESIAKLNPEDVRITVIVADSDMVKKI